MGTRSVTYIHKNGIESEVICAIYRQSGGYPTGMGDDIVKILGHKTVVNGIPWGVKDIVNGMGCAAAQLVSELKEGAVNIYIYHPETRGEEFDYHIYFDGDVLDPPSNAKLSMKAMSSGDVFYNGLIADFDGKEIEKSFEENE